MAIRYTHKEELWNSWSHAGGIVMGVIFGVIFLWMSFRGDTPSVSPPASLTAFAKHSISPWFTPPKTIT